MKRTEEFDLPYPVSLNQAYRAWNNRVVKSAEARAYEEKVLDNLIMLRLNSFNEDRLKVTVTAYMPDKRRRDLSNLDKVLMDSLEKGGLFNNDEQIDDLRFIRAGVCKPGRVRIKIENIPEKKK